MIHRRAEMAFGYRRHRGLWLTLRLVAATQTPQFIYHALQLVDVAMFNPPILNRDILLQDLVFRVQMPRYAMPLDYDEGAEPNV